MTERPIIFSAPMVKALLDGRKSMTRRILSRRNVLVLGESWAGKSWHWEGLRFNEATVRTKSPIAGIEYSHLAVPFCHPDDEPTPTNECGVYRVRPVIEPNDLLWVRENWSHGGAGVWTISDARLVGGRAIYAADGGNGPWWPSIHMPREFSRITLKVTAVKVERLQDILHADAVAEGVEGSGTSWKNYDPGEPFMNAVASFITLWNSINGHDSWLDNPFVVAISFEVIKKNIGAVLTDDAGSEAA